MAIEDEVGIENDSSNGLDMRPVPVTVANAREPGLLERGLRGMVKLGVDAVTLPVKLTRSVVMSDAMTPAREVANSTVNTVVDASVSIVGDTMRGNEEFTQLIGSIVARLLKELRASDMLADLIRTQVGMFLDYLVRNPDTLSPLVNAVAENYLLTLRQNPTLLRPLVRSIAGDYLSYLSNSPDELEGLVDGVAGGYLATLRSRPQMLDGLVQIVAARYIESLGKNQEQLAPLVDAVAGDYLALLAQEPERLDALVRKVGDRYLDYLNQEPAQVQELLAGQSQSLAAGVLNEVRERSATGDYAMESFFRRMLRKPPRAPMPSAESGTDAHASEAHDTGAHDTDGEGGSA